MIFTATYSPDDNKLRLYAGSRLDSELYQRVKSAGFQWAPKQDLFYATWNPVAEDLLLELASEIEDEDKSLTVRAEERSERFEGYQDRRAEDADRARTAVSAIADNIPFGQPILIGHHSERRARKDAERIKNSMRKAIKLWETSEYWASRAAGALRHAKYKELPAVRARRIKTIEAEFRKWQREQAEAEKWLSAWTRDGLTIEGARTIANYCNLIVEKHTETSSYWHAYDVLRPEEDRYKACPAYTVEQVQDKARERYPKYIAKTQRWIDHLNHRLDYEKALLNEQGASALLDKKPKSAKAQLPLVNYRGENGVIIAVSPWHRGQLDTLKQVDMTAAEYAEIHADYKGTRIVEGSHRVRTTMERQSHCLVSVFITDSKTHPKPEPVATQPKATLQPIQQPVYVKPPEDPRAEEFSKLKELARQGVEVVSSPDLFVTPPALAQRVSEVADIQAGHSVLEPSAGTLARC